jgi:hypothetical protein
MKPPVVMACGKQHALTGKFQQVACQQASRQAGVGFYVFAISINSSATSAKHFDSPSPRSAGADIHPD